MRRALVVIITLGVILTVQPPQACAQTPASFDAWFEEQVAALIREASVDLNNNDPRRQRDTPAADPNSASLVDQSSASDFISVALSLIRDQATTASASNATGTLTMSAYSLLALASGTDMADPAFYKEHTGARKIYLTVGTAASRQQEDNTGSDATVLGIKYLLWNKRDLYAAGNLQQLENVQEALTNTAAARAQTKDAVQRLIFALARPNAAPTLEALSFAFGDNFPTIYALLTPGRLKQVKTFIRNQLEPFQLLRAELEAANSGIRNRAQFAVAYTAKLRRDEGNHDHQFTLIYDHGLTDRLSWTVNAAGNVKDRRTTGSEHGGRIGTEFLSQLTTPGSEMWGRTPMTVSFSGEAKARTKEKPTFTFQARLTIPIATGIDLPIVYRFANRTVMSAEANPETRLGLTVDTGRLMQLFR